MEPAGTAARLDRAAAAHRTASIAQVLKRVPTLKKLDGQPVDVEEREAARK